ncbi:MAG: hypothetical protein O4749_04115 [Trichodesmium sp. St5_bin2_1]|nr:hypothetical protein [Trichodesmium sp. St5_bin2_1]
MLGFAGSSLPTGVMGTVRKELGSSERSLNQEVNKTFKTLTYFCSLCPVP